MRGLCEYDIIFAVCEGFGGVRRVLHGYMIGGFGVNQSFGGVRLKLM